MSNYTRHLNNQTLEIIYPKPQNKKQTFFEKLNKLFQELVFALTKEPEPQIKQLKNRFGDTYWRAYDPKTGHSAYLASEAEVKSWLEGRFRQRS